MRPTICLTALLVLAGCTAPYPTRSSADLVAIGVKASEASRLAWENRDWEVNTGSSKVDGTRDCSASRGNLMAFYIGGPAGRRATISTWKKQYPGSYFTANIGGTVFDGEERIALTDQVAAALAKGGNAYFRYATWPGRAAAEFTVNVDDFAQAHAKCAAFVGG